MEFKTEFNNNNDNELNDSYLMDNGSSGNGYNQNTNETGSHNSLSPTDNNRNRSRSRSYDDRVSYSRSRSPRNRNSNGNTEYSNDREANNNNNNHRQSRRGYGGDSGRSNRYTAQSRYSDKDLGLKYRWEKTVFVSNIPYDVKWPELKDLFRSKIGDIHFCEIFEKDGKSLGVGTIEFKLLEDAEKAVELMNQYDMGTRKITVRMDNDGSRTRKAKEMSRDYYRQQQSSNSYNNDNHQQQQQSSLLSALGSNNILAALGLSNNASSGGGGGLNTQSILNLLTTSGSSSSGGGGGISTSSAATSLSPTNSSSQLALLNQIAAQNNIEGTVTSRVFVASLDYKVDEHKIKEVFQLAGKVLAVSLFKDRDGKSRGMSVVEYATPQEALNACLMFNNQVLNNRTMNVRFDTKPPKEDEIQSSPKLPSGLKSIGYGLGLGGLSSLQPKPLESSNSLSLDALTALTGLNSNSSNLSALAGLAGLTSGNGNLGLSNLLGSFNSNSKPTATTTISKIFIKNIPFSWDERRLKEKFRQAGNIEFVEIKHRDGKSRGCGLIKFSTPDQALKAVELFNGSRFEGRTLEVKLDQLSS